MDASDLKSAGRPVGPEPVRSHARPHVAPRVVRTAVVGLAIVLAVGLWQAYGAWLFSTAASHVF
jgi:hypothetical protein